MKIILSRKGFDSKNGGIASPILPDGALLSLPIPDPYWMVHWNRPDASKMVTLGSIDFGKTISFNGDSEYNKKMYDELKKQVEGNSELKDYMIFEEDYTVWLIWWGENVSVG